MAYFRMYGGKKIIPPIQITVTLYSAASDTVSFTDDNGSHNINTDSTGKATNVSIKYTPSISNDGIEFTSSVAKDYINPDNNYVKVIKLSGNETALYIMPDNSYYWWGYISPLIGSWKKIKTTCTVNINTNYLELIQTQTATGTAFGALVTNNKVDLSSFTELHTFTYRSDGKRNSYLYLTQTNSSVTYDGKTEYQPYTQKDNYVTHNIVLANITYTNPAYFEWVTFDKCTMRLYAIFAE